MRECEPPRCNGTLMLFAASFGEATPRTIGNVRNGSGDEATAESRQLALMYRHDE